MKTLIYSKDKIWYYIDELACPQCNWLSVQTFTDQPKFAEPFAYTVEYENKYHRIVKPFQFWKINEGESKQVKDRDDLVNDYFTCGHEKDLKCLP